MTLDKFTIKAQEAIQKAQEIAMSRQHPHCDGQVIAAALLADVSW